MATRSNRSPATRATALNRIGTTPPRSSRSRRPRSASRSSFSRTSRPESSNGRCADVSERRLDSATNRRITELDIDSNDDKLQADYLRDFLPASFSHPNTNGLLMWGSWEPAHWRPNAAMYRTIVVVLPD